MQPSLLLGVISRLLSGIALGAGEELWLVSLFWTSGTFDGSPHRQFPLRLFTVTLSEPHHGKKQFRGPIWSQLRRNLLWLRSKRRAQQSVLLEWKDTVQALKHTVLKPPEFIRQQVLP